MKKFILSPNNFYLKTYQIHITGIVQGVGFRPYIYNFFNKKNISGIVFNTNDGVQIFINCEESKIISLLDNLVLNKPKIAKIKTCIHKITENKIFNGFEIIESNSDNKPSLLLTPDFGICEQCNKELLQIENKRYQYPFTTCTNCGPRLSIVTDLPYDRKNTTMNNFSMCSSCKDEYDNPNNRRFHSQTNSCPNCKIQLALFENGKWQNDYKNYDYIIEQWCKGKIIAIKGLGGFLLTCDANNSETIKRLRILKNRPSKPFALMYHDVYELAEDVEMGIGEKLEIEELYAPIVLLTIKKEMDRWTKLAVNDIAPNLNSVGVMLPNTPLFKILLDKYKKPIIATSANLSGEPIIFDEEKSLNDLTALSDLILSNNRKITIPQDDSVVKLSSIKFYKTIFRRSRGLAPSYLNTNLKLPKTSILGLGAMLKSTFTILNNKKIHVSQYIGNTADYQTQENFKNTLNTYQKLLKPNFDVILTDKHSGYFTNIYGKELAEEKGIEIVEVQHHKAHLFAVLGENNLLETDENILGIIWDGTGLGDDGNIWGGEFFLYNNGTTNRVHHLDEFPFIVGDKLPKEPRISAFVIAAEIENKKRIKSKFSKTEWNVYKKLLKSSTLKSTSIGRLFDAAASIILGIDKQTYEGEAAMQLESAAHRYFRKNNFTKYYSYLNGFDEVPVKFTVFLLQNIIIDLNKEFNPDFIAAKFHITLAHYMSIIANEQARKNHLTKVVFSGGVFQNQWLKELILSFMQNDFELFFHNELSPNDENISFGQLMYYIYSK